MQAVNIKNKVVLFKSKDKASHEAWYPNRGITNFPTPFRAVIISPPNGGKTCVAKNLIISQEPPFKKIFLMHAEIPWHNEREDSDSENEDDEEEDTVPEYSDIDYIPLNHIPKPKEFDGQKALLIIDDRTVKAMNKQERSEFARLFSFTSTHRNLSIIMCTQDAFHQLSTSVLRFANIFIVFHYDELNYLRMLADRIGVDRDKQSRFVSLLKNFDIHDSICLDKTQGTKYSIRKNLFELIDL